MAVVYYGRMDPYKEIFYIVSQITPITLPYTYKTQQSVILRCFVVEEFSVVI
jgi:hypothetical protein